MAKTGQMVSLVSVFQVPFASLLLPSPPLPSPPLPPFPSPPLPSPPLLSPPSQAAVRIMAKDLVRTRNHVKKFYLMKANIQAISLKLQVLCGQDTSIYDHVCKCSCILFPDTAVASSYGQSHAGSDKGRPAASSLCVVLYAGS